MEQEGYNNSAMVAVDGLLESSWQEGVSGNGEGEYLELYLHGAQPIKYLEMCIRDRALLDGYKRSQKKQKKGCMIGCGIVVILVLAAVIFGAIGSIMQSGEKRKKRQPEEVQTISGQQENGQSQNPENIETETVLPETVQNETIQATETVPESVDLASVQAVRKESASVDISSSAQ